MSRPLRLDFPGAVWHVFTRGNERRDIFYKDSDRQRLLKLLSKVTEDFRWRIYSYCLMSNHYDPNFALAY
jgi:putative transposase